jgi:hypothetical protein
MIPKIAQCVTDIFSPSLLAVALFNVSIRSALLIGG